MLSTLYSYAGNECLDDRIARILSIFQLASTSPTVTSGQLMLLLPSLMAQCIWSTPLRTLDVSIGFLYWPHRTPFHCVCKLRFVTHVNLSPMTSTIEVGVPVQISSPDNDWEREGGSCQRRYHGLFILCFRLTRQLCGGIHWTYWTKIYRLLCVSL